LSFFSPPVYIVDTSFRQLQFLGTWHLIFVLFF